MKSSSTQLSFNTIETTNDKVKNLFFDLLNADTESSVIEILKKHNYWDHPSLWRFYGDKESNYSTIGNQSASSEAALVEKIVNSIDAVLMNECYLSGILPIDSQAPSNIIRAVAKYFGDNIERMGNIINWSNEKRKEVSRRITVAATGSRTGKPCFTITDNGEGQTPYTINDTILSLDRRNKVSIHFVQGTFNMGGTGVLKFCGEHNLQLVLTRRNPKIINTHGLHDDNNKWSFTIIRRENPPPGEKNSIYTYLAPINATENPRKGGVMRFSAENLPIYPVRNKPYVRESEWGTLIKLYEYQATGFRSHILMPDGLLSRLDILLPQIALPIRLHECRNYGGVDERSFETTISGLSVRLGDDKAKNLEEGFPDAGQFMVNGQRMNYTVYAFKPDKSKTYKNKSEGIIFTINGQTHATISSDFFTRDKVKKGRIKDSILLIVDCTKIDGRTREDLFPNSRDRLSKNDFRNAMESQLESILFHHQGLRDLSEKRRQEEFEAAIEDDKPLTEAFERILKSSPTLSSLFIAGTKISNPFKTRQVGSEAKPYEGKRYPSFFKFQKLDYGNKLCHKTPKNMRCRIAFETDVVNDYFARVDDRGDFILKSPNDERTIAQTDYSLTLRDGKAVLSLNLPDNSIVGQTFEFEAIITDSTLIDDFINRFEVTVVPEQKVVGSIKKNSKPPSDTEGANRELPSGLNQPDIREVSESNWGKYEFDKYSALKITQEDVQTGENDSDINSDLYTYYVNIDNIYLQNEAKSSKIHPDILKKRFIYGMVLFGMSLVLDYKKSNTTISNSSNNSQTIEDLVLHTSNAIAPVLLPIIDKLGAFTEDDVSDYAYNSGMDA
jgi:hypothetical protein